MAGEPIPMPSTKVALLPCPFCGGEASAEGRVSYTENHEAWFADGTQVLEAFYCNCMKCGATRQPIVGGYQSRDLAITAWNTRSTPIVDVTRVEKLREAADILDQYASFIRTDVKADDLERHPYVPQIEQCADDLRAALDGTRVDAGEGEAIADLHRLQHDGAKPAAQPVGGGSIIRWAADEIAALRASTGEGLTSGERLALRAIKAVTATAKDGPRALSRIMAIAHSAGVPEQYTALLADPDVALIVQQPRTEWAHLFKPGAEGCAIPPEGWTCSRARGHAGPCAASPSQPTNASVREGKDLAFVIAEAKRTLRIVQCTMECNADDERRWADTIEWLEGLA